MKTLLFETEIIKLSKKRTYFINIWSKVVFNFLFLISGGAVTKIAHAMVIFSGGKGVASAGACADTACSCREAKTGSNIIVFEVDSLFSDFGRFVIVSFFVDPPAVGSVFPVEMSQVIAMLSTCQKTGDQENKGNNRCD